MITEVIWFLWIILQLLSFQTVMCYFSFQEADSSSSSPEVKKSRDKTTTNGNGNKFNQAQNGSESPKVTQRFVTGCCISFWWFLDLYTLFGTT